MRSSSTQIMVHLKICSCCSRKIKAVTFKLFILSITTCGLGSGESARSQIAGDGTPTQTMPTLVNNSPTTSCTGTCNITGGTPIGSTLFHSFEQFSLPSGTFAIFTNPDPAIENVISRVTGTTPSQIDGFIGAGGMYPDFNLFLINPNGIIFGADAELNLNGSFIATTASSIKFDNGAEFGINSLTSPPILTVNVPVGLQFGVNPGSIQVQSSGVFSPPFLRVPSGNTLALIGGDVEMRGGSAIVETPGRLEIGGVGANSLVNLNSSPTGFALDYSNVQDYRDVRLSQGTQGLADSGQIQVRGKRVFIEGGSLLAASPFSSQPGGDINIYGAESVEILGASGTINSGLYVQNQGGSGDAGNITVTTPDFKIRDGGTIVSPTLGAGQAGNIMINAERLTISDGANISASTFNTGQGGNIIINNARVVEISGELSFLSTKTFGAGTAGNIRIDTEQLYITNAAQIRSTSEGSGAAGNIDILNADIISLDRGGTLLAEAMGSGDAGTIQLQTRLLVMDNKAEVTVRSTGTGMAGNIDVDARIVELDNNATLSAENNATGGGSITLRNLQLLNLDRGSEISASTVDGQGGTINVNAGWINLERNSRILSTAMGLGNSGRIDLTAGWLTLNNASQVAANHTGFGQAGDVTLRAGWLNLDNASQVTVSHEGFGNAGNLIAIANRIDLNNQSQLSSATNSGLGGNIAVDSQTFLNLNNSTISAATQGGTGGTISVRATDAIALNQNSRLLANTTGTGTAGNLNLTTGTLTVQNDSQIATSSMGGGNAGSLEVSARQIELRDRALLTSETRDGIGGNITLRDWQTLSLDNHSQVSASTVNGQGGTLTLSGFGDLTLNNSSNLLANATESGNAGNLNINTAGKLSIENNSEVAVRNTGTGDAGNLTIRAADIFLSQRGRLAASTAAGNGGNIDLRVDNSIVLRFNSEISAEAGGAGNGGNIAISAGGYILGVLSENSDIVANAFQGNGGNITATALGVFNFRQFRQRRTPESDFIASSEVGIDGMVTINTQEQPQLEPLPDDFLNTRVAEACDPLSRITDVGFYILGRRGLPPDPPFESLSSDGIWEDLRNPNEPSPRSNRLGEPVVEAQGWIVNERGNVVLVAESPEPPREHCAISLGWR